MNDYVWKTRDGNEIKVTDMTSQHIINCINCLETGKIIFTINMGWAPDNDYQEYCEDVEREKKWIKIFKTELARRKYVFESMVK